MQVILAPDVLTNPLSISTTTWNWRTSDASGNESDDFTATLVTGGSTTTASPTTVPDTTEPSPSTTAASGGGDPESGDSDTTGGSADLTDTGTNTTVPTAIAAILLVLGCTLILGRRRLS